MLAPLVFALLSLAPLDAKGYQRVLDENRGHLIVVAFWATWCQPCREEMPRLRRLLQGTAARLITISADEPEQAEAAEQFLKMQRIGGPTYRVIDTQMIAVVDPEWSGVLPATFVYTAEGRLAAKFRGEMNWRALQRLVAPAQVGSKQD